MKKLEMKEMAVIEGGLNIVNLCNAYAFAVVTEAGSPVGSAERYILAQLAFNYCLFG